MKYCPQCGYGNIDEAEYCLDCGAKLKEKANKNPKIQQNAVQPKPIIEKDNSIISKFFLKPDTYTGRLRVGKAKSISIGVFIIMFAFSMIQLISTKTIVLNILASIIFALIFAVPVYIIGFVLGRIIENV